MARSKILQAIDKFKAEYAWDKSLIVVARPGPIALPAITPSEAQYFDPLERFQELENGKRAR